MFYNAKYLFHQTFCAIASFLSYNETIKFAPAANLMFLSCNARLNTWSVVSVKYTFMPMRAMSKHIFILGT